MYACGDLIGAQTTVHITVDRYFSHDFRASCSNVWEYYEWESAVGAGRGTSV